MLTSLTLWIVLAALLILSVFFGLCLWILLRWRRQEQAMTKELLLSSRSSQSEQSALLDKTVALLASRDALTFQQVQLMNQPSGYDEPAFDPSDAGEIERIRHESPLAADQGDLNDFEQEVASEFGFDAGDGA
jgi:hypothetical protein